MQAASTALRFTTQRYRTDATTAAAAALEMLAALILVAILQVEHRHAIRASAFLALYLTLCTVLAGAESRSFFLRDLTSNGGVAAGIAVARFAIVVLQEVPRLNLLIDPEIRQQSKGEAAIGFWTRSFFCYIFPLFRIGYSTALRISHITTIGIEFSSKKLLASLSTSWKPHDRKKPHSLLLACCWEWKYALLSFTFARLCQTGFTFAQPFSIQRVVAAVEEGIPDPALRGSLVAANFLTFAASAVCRTITSHMAFRLSARIRGGLMSLMLDKNLRLEVAEARKNAVVTLMSTDMDAIMSGLPLAMETPFMVLECGLGIFYLERLIQQSCFVVVVPLLLSTGVGFFLGKYLTVAQRRWFEASGVRVTAISKMLPQLRAVKMLGLGPKLAKYLQHLRLLEMEKFKIFRRGQVFMIISAITSEELCSTLIITVALLWGAFGNALSPQQVYPTLTVVSLVQYPIAMLFRTVPMAMNTLGCLERIREFLCLEEHSDPRHLSDPQPQEATQTELAIGKAGSSTPQAAERAGNASRLIHFENASIAPIGSATAVLQNINLSLLPGSILGVFGSTGSGKTTFLHSILGEIKVLEGRIFVKNIPIAYVGQEIYLPNLSVRDCVVGHCMYNEARFKAVITACKLLEDIQQLPDGENYVVGTGGIALSGGQRQRLNIARAAYIDAQVVILDDALSALDRKTANAILENLCGENGLFKNSGTTVVIASYLPECLELATELIFLEGDGHFEHEIGGASPEFAAKVLHLLRQRRGNIPEESDGGTESLSDGAKPRADQCVDGPVRHRTDLSLYWFWAQAAGLKSICYWAFVIVIASFIDVFILVYLRLWIATAPSNRYWLIGYDILPFLLAIFSGLGVLLLFNGSCTRAAIVLHGETVITITGSTLGFLSVTDAGSLLNRLSLDMEILTRRVPPALHNTAYQLLGLMGRLGVAVAGSVYMLIFLPVVLIVILAIQRFYLRTSRQLRQLEIESQAPIVTSVSEASQGLVYVRSFGWKRQQLDEGLRALDNSQKPTFMLASGQHLLQLCVYSLMAILTLVLSLLALYISHGRTANSIGAAFLSIVVLGERLSDSIQNWTVLEIAIGALERVRSFLKNTPRERSGTSSLPENWPSKGEIVVEDLTARYRADNEGPQAPVLRNVSLSIEAGKRISVVGRTGSGKSSFLQSLLGFLDYTGKITIDGVEISDAPLDELRSRIITISQDQIELSGSVRDNLLPFEKELGSEALETETDEKVKEKEAAKDLVIEETLVQLKIWEKVKANGGIGALLKDVGYSHGEKQLLCIARAVVRRRLTKSKVLLVDEATGSVDQQYDNVVREMMKEHFQDCTIIGVAHREESIADADMKVEMTNGTMGKPELL